MSGNRLRDIEERLKAATGDLFRTGEGTYSTLIAHAPDDLAYLLRVARAAEAVVRERDEMGTNFKVDALRRVLEDADA